MPRPRFFLFAVLRQPNDEAPPSDHQRLLQRSLAALFFLHPVHVESYVWINGRSDLLGGFWLVALAFVLAKAKDSSSSRVGPTLVVGLVAFLGASSKLPFVIAAGAVWLAWSVRERLGARRVYGAADRTGGRSAPHSSDGIRTFPRSTSAPPTTSSSTQASGCPFRS